MCTRVENYWLQQNSFSRIVVAKSGPGTPSVAKNRKIQAASGTGANTYSLVVKMQTRFRQGSAPGLHRQEGGRLAAVRGGGECCPVGSGRGTAFEGSQASPWH